MLIAPGAQMRRIKLVTDFRDEPLEKTVTPNSFA